MQVGSSSLVSGADYALSSIHNIKEAIPDIWENDLQGEGGGDTIIIQPPLTTLVEPVDVLA